MLDRIPHATHINFTIAHVIFQEIRLGNIEMQFLRSVANPIFSNIYSLHPIEQTLRLLQEKTIGATNFK